MPILFSVVGQRQNIIADFASCDGNFIEITRQILSKLNSCNDKMTYYHGPYLLHYTLEDTYIYFCITDKTCQRSRAFLFLNQIQRRFVAEGKQHFVKALADEMYRYSEDYSTISIMKGELDMLNSIGVESSESILGEKVLFVTNTDNLSYASVDYVGKTPERVTVTESEKQSMSYVVVIIGMLLIFASSTVYIFGPVSCIMVIAALSYCFFAITKRKTDL